MAKILISSTCYDLKETRNQLEFFLKTIGHDPVLSENNDVFYNPRLHTHTSCVEFVSKCDMVIFLIGGRFGGTAIPDAYETLNSSEIHSLLDNSFSSAIDQALECKLFSITQLEVLKAIQLGKPVYTFISKDVYSDHNLYEKNKGKCLDIEFPSISKQGTATYIFEFINVMRKRCVNNAIYTFEVAQDIEKALLKQFAHIFDRGLLDYPFDSVSMGDIRSFHPFSKRDAVCNKMVFTRYPIMTMILMISAVAIIGFVTFLISNNLVLTLIAVCIGFFVYCVVNGTFTFFNKRLVSRAIINSYASINEYIYDCFSRLLDERRHNVSQRTEAEYMQPTKSTGYISDLAEINNMNPLHLENVLKSIFFVNGAFDAKNSIVHLLVNTGYYDESIKRLITNISSLQDSRWNKELVMNQFSVLLSIKAIDVYDSVEVVNNNTSEFDSSESATKDSLKFGIVRDVLLWANSHIDYNSSELS